MEGKRRSFPERTYKANILPGGLTYKISPMAMIIDQMRRDSLSSGVEHDSANSGETNTDLGDE